MLFFWNFLLRIGLERNETIVFIFVSFSAISNQFLLEKKPLPFFSNFLKIFAISYEFPITPRVGTKRIDNFYFPCFSVYSNQLWLEMKPQWYFFRFFPIFLKFSITRQVGTERDDSFCFLHFSAFSPLFWLEMKP